MATFCFTIKMTMAAYPGLSVLAVKRTEPPRQTGEIGVRECVSVFVCVCGGGGRC